MANFHADLAFADRARTRLDDYFYPKMSRAGQFVAIEVSAGSLHVQKTCHIDCIVAAKQGGSVTVEEKLVRWPGRQYDAIVIETHSNLEWTKDEPIGDGWIQTSMADFLLYAFEQQDGRLLVWLFELPGLREWFNQVFEGYPITDTRNQKYTTRCRLVPLADIPQTCIRLRNYEV